MYDKIKQKWNSQKRFGYGRTENGALTYNSSTNYVLDLFFKIPAMRAQPESQLHEMFQKAWLDNPELTVRVMLWARDVRGGAGERRVFREFLKWLYINNYEDVLQRVLKKVPELGRWDDMFVLPIGEWIHFVKRNLYTDNLLAKWLPREKSRKWPGLAKQIAKRLGMSLKDYRKIIARMSKTVEQQMSANQWKEIDYAKVPSIAGLRYRNAFMRHDPDRYMAFIEKVKQGKEKINVSILFPHDVIKQFKNTKTVGDVDAVITMWNNLPNYMEEVDGFVLPVLDFSASMQAEVSKGTSALDIAHGLGLYFADKQPEPWKNIVIPFSRTAKFVVLEGDNIYSKYLQLLEYYEVANTNLQAVFDLILDFATKHDLQQSEMPKYLLIVSDMEFDEATSHGYWHEGTSWDKTNYEVMKEKFERHGYELPTIIFWNVMSRNTGNVPVRAGENNVVLVSGYSPQIMKTILQLNENNISPVNMMLKTILVPRYDF